MALVLSSAPYETGGADGFATGNFQYFKQLYEDIRAEISQAAAASEAPSKSLHTILSHARPDLLYPLKAPPRSEEAKRIVGTGNVILDGRSFRLGSDLVKQTLDVSEVLQINELAAANLVKFSLAQRSRYLDEEVPEIAQIIFFSERRYLLLSLLTLIKARNSYVINEPTKQLIIKFTNDLLISGLTANLLSLSFKILEEVRNAKPEDLTSSKNEERQMLAENLFYIYYQTLGTSKDTLNLLKLLNESTSLTHTKRKDSNYKASNSEVQTNYTLLLSVLCALDPKNPLMNPVTGETSTNAVEAESEFIRSFNGEVAGRQWDDTRSQNAVLMVWSQFLQYADKSPLPETAFEEHTGRSIKEGIACLTSVVLSDPFAIDTENLEIYAVVIQDVIILLIQTIPYWVNITNQPGFLLNSFMSLIAAVHQDRPEACRLFWSNQPQPQLTAFIRIISDRLGEGLFVPYLKMLAALASGPESANYVFHLVKSGMSKIVHWDHFFSAFEKYLNEYREPSPQEQQFYHQPARRKIRDEDIEALEAILQLMQQVLKNNPQNRTLMFENPQWRSLDHLFGLLACPVQSSLKAELTLAIAAFAKSSEIATKIWMYLEFQQVLATVPTTGVPKEGIRYELEEVEANMETYPYITAFMTLIAELLNHPVPPNLGSPNRTPGFLPYLAFILQNVFLKFDTRAYRDQSEMWKVGVNALRILYKVLTRYELVQSDFVDATVEVQGRSLPMPKSAGFELMKNLLSGGPTLAKLLWIVEQAASWLRDSRSDASGTLFEECTLLSLQIIEHVQRAEVRFMEALKTFNNTALVTSIDRYLVQSRSPAINIALLVDYPRDPKISLCAIKILHRLSISERRLVSIFEEIGAGRYEIMRAFAEKLEREDDTENDEVDLLGDPQTSSARLAIVQLLQDNLAAPAPNLAHLLLGFALESIPESDLESLSIVTCLHTITEMLSKPNFCRQSPALAEGCYQLVYKLCANALTGLATLRFLRSRDFFVRQLHLLPTSLHPENVINQLRQRGWLYKTIALELHASSSIEHRQSLLSVLYGNEYLREEDEIPEDGDMNDNYGSSRMQIFEMLDAVTFPLSDPPILKRSTFANVQVESCYLPNSQIIDMKKLHSLLLQEKQRFDYNMAIGIQEQINDEIRSILKNAAIRNNFTEKYLGQRLAFTSWKQILEITLIQCYDYLRTSGKESVLYELLDNLLQKQNSEETRIQIASLIAETVAVLLHKLREQKRYLANITAAEATASGLAATGRDLPVDQLLSILHGIITGILRTGALQSMRGHLYMALLNFLQFTHKTPAFFTDQFVDNAQRVWFQQELELQSRHLEDGTFTVLSAAGTKLIKVVCDDASDSVQIWQSLAFATLDILMQHDRKHEWLMYLATSGYLAHFINTFKSKEDQLLAVLRPNTDMLKPLFVYESMMSFLLHVAQTARGAHTLADLGFVRNLTSCNFVDHRPEDTYHSMENEWLPSVLQRYDQLLFPILRILVAMMTSLPRNQDLAIKIVDFVDVHSELFFTLLKDRSPVITESTLYTLFLSTSLFYQLAVHNDIVEQKLSSKAPKFEALMVNLLRKYSVKERWEKYTKNKRTLGDEQRFKCTKQSMEALVLNICRNVVFYCRILSDSPFERIIFTPKVNEGFQNEQYQDFLTTRGKPSLAIVIGFLKSSIDYFFKASREQQSLRAKLHHQNELSHEDENTLAQQMHVDTDDMGLPADQRRHLVQKRLLEIVNEKTESVGCLLYTIENLLYLLLRHLQFFFSSNAANRRATLASELLTSNELADLKQEVSDSLSQIQAGQTESTLNVLTKLEEVANPQKSGIIYVNVRQLKELLRR
eukprot:TRINITY_DN4519_c0_g2_i1.p1 TRINITY_DN4519_c0_g2~~TRINITY_DN4519_c0_g2_i1.p1  ORF type:complete len:1835 (+),score=550.65 TRINITY_DN4519_c0_g2_i1:218-5722(+)